MNTKPFNTIRIASFQNILFYMWMVLWFSACTENHPSEENFSLDHQLISLNHNGGWCWFQGPRIVSDGEYIIIGSVAIGDERSTRNGDIDAVIYNLIEQEVSTSTLSANLQANDHATPAFLQRPDNSWLSVYSRHGDDNYFLYRISEPENPTVWGEEKTFTPSETTEITYSNLYLLENEDNRIYNFFRGLDISWKPSYAYSDDLGETWQTGNIFIDVPTEERHRPYVIYAGDGESTIHMAYTEGHPRRYPNSIYHIFYQNEMLYKSDGTPLVRLDEGLSDPQEGTLVYQGSEDSVHWTTDLILDEDLYPRMVFSTRRNDTEVSEEDPGNDQRYHYARWDGQEWHVHEIAYAGSKLYPGEDEYTGLAAIDPRNPDIVYISADVDPSTGEPLISETDGNRHYEIFKGETSDGGANWDWTALTKDSQSDNLRPIAVQVSNNQTFLAWLQGEYRTYTDYTQQVVGLIVE